MIDTVIYKARQESRL